MRYRQDRHQPRIILAQPAQEPFDDDVLVALVVREAKLHALLREPS